MSLTVLTIDKDGVIAEYTIKKYVESELYKACGYKTASRYFTHIHTWNFASGASASLYGKCYDKADGGKSYGKEDMINKYNFPPPADNVLLYGTCCIVMKQNAIPANMTVAAWRIMYNTLFKGFEDLKDTETADEAELEESDSDDEDKADTTRDGYEKDGFVVSESDTDSDTEDEDEPAGDGEECTSDNESVDGDLELEQGDEADNEAEPEDEIEDDDVEADADADADTEENYASDDDDDSDIKSKKRKLSAGSKKPTKSKGKSKGGGSGEILLFETNELEKDEYIATDDEA